MSEMRTDTRAGDDGKIYGAKLLRPDHTSIGDEYGRVQYRYGWQTIPGNGAYIAVTGGADAADVPADAVIRWFECDPASEIKPDDSPPFGVRCFRRVRMLRRRPKGLLPLAERRGRTIIAQGWYPNGQQMYRCEYQGSLLHGVWMGWHENGQLKHRHPYRNERLHGTVEVWREDGSPIYREEYRKGRRHDICMGWYPNGQPEYRHQYRDGRPHGLHEGWHPNGKQVYRHEYRDGKRIA